MVSNLQSSEYLCKMVLILSKFGFSKKGIADLYGIARTNLYKWIRKEVSPGEYYHDLSCRLFLLCQSAITIHSTKEQKLFIKESIQSYKDSVVSKQLKGKLDKHFTGEEKYERNKKELLEETPFCNLCGTTNHVLDTHHIIYRSEAPKHKSLHDKRNLIVLCRECHNKMHENKNIRELLVKQRKLHLLFKQLHDWITGVQTNITSTQGEAVW